MREFELLIDRAFTRGIRSNPQEGLSLQTLYTAYNVKAGKHGLEPYSVITMPTAWNLTLPNYWPYPMIHTGVGGTSHAITKQVSDGKIRLYKINSNNTVTLKHTFSAGVLTSTVIDIADFGNYVMFVTDAYSLAFDVEAEAYTPDWDIAYPVMIPTELCCNFRGQFIYARPKVFSSDLPIPQYNANKYVGYSNIGSIVIRTSQQIEAGSSFIPTSGEVLRILPMADHIIVYCSDSIWALSPKREPVFTYSPTLLYGEGIAWKHAVDGGTQHHVAILASGEVLMIDNGLKVINLDFSERFNVPYSTTAVYDAQYNEWRISDTTTGYILSGKGLTSCNQRVTGILQNTNYGAVISGTDYSVRFKTDVLNFGMAGIKTITGIEVNGQEYPLGGTVSVDYKYDLKSLTFMTSPEVPINPMGWVAAPVSGMEMRVNVTFSGASNVYLRHLKIRWKMSDIRSLRGIYSPPPRGQYVD